nr:hypothetical protein CFP56_70969 [Quercus suber]
MQLTYLGHDGDMRDFSREHSIRHRHELQLAYAFDGNTPTPPPPVAGQGGSVEVHSRYRYRVVTVTRRRLLSYAIPLLIFRDIFPSSTVRLIPQRKPFSTNHVSYRPHSMYTIVGR